MEVELQIGSKSIKIDKGILSKYSDYFEAMFTSPFAEQSLHVIPLKNMNFKSVNVIVEFMYSGKLALTSLNIEDIFLTADFLQIHAARQRCLDLFGRYLTHENCLNIYKLAVEHGFNNTTRKAMDMILKCFEQIYEDLEFLDMPCRLLVDILCDHNLNISEEIIAFHTIEKWINHDRDNRELFKGELMQCIMAELLPKNDLFQILNSSLIKKESKLKDELKQRFLGKQESKSRDSKKEMTWIGKERVGMIHNRIYVIGALVDTATRQSEIKVFLPKDMKHPRNSTSDLSTHLVNCTIADSNADSNANNTTDNSRVALVRPPRGSGIYGRCGTVIGTSAYVVCNRSISAGPPANVLCKLDLHLQQFCELSEVPIWVDHMSLTNSDGKVYVIGGYKHTPGTQGYPHDHEGFVTPSNLVQIYNISSAEWSRGPDLITERAHAACIGLSSGGGLQSRVFVLGGYGGNKLDSVEVITGGTSSTEMPHMIKPRHSFCAGMVEGMIIVVGGWNEPTVERYDFRNKQWSLLSKFTKHRDCLRGGVCDGILYVFGGVKNNKNISTIDKYDFEKDTWTTVGHLSLPGISAAIAIT